MGIVEDHVRLQRIASGFPVVTKLWLLFLGPLTVILAVCVEDAIQKGNEESRRQAVAQAPAYMNHFESLIQSVTAERAAAMQFLSTRNRTSLEEAHANTDAETAQMNRVLSRLTAEGVSSDSYTKSFSAKDIAHARSLTVSSNIPEKYVFYAYSEVIRNSLSAIFADFHSSPKGMLLTTQVSMSISNAYLKLEQAAFLHANSVAPTEVTASMRKRMLKLRVGRESYTELLEGVIPDGTYLDMIHDDAGYKELLKRDVPEVRMNCSKAETGLAAEIVSLLDNAATEISESTVEHIDTSLDAITVHLSLDIACIIVLIVFFAVQVAIMAVRRMNNSYEKDKSEELNAMIDTVDRIAEYSAYFAMFDLRVPLLPAGRTLTHLELTLMKCQAALKIVAPALPPELFPERYVVKQQTENIAQRDMCDMELMMNQLPPHHPDSVPVVHSTLREANSAKATSLMTRRCKLGLQEQEGAFLTVSFSWLHSRVDNNNGQQPKYVEPYISLIENAVVTHEGLVHKLCGDRMLCSWNIASWVEESSLLACKAGLAILPATTPLYKSNEIHVACAVTYGKVLAGNVGFSPNTQGGIDSPLTAKDVGTSMRTPVAVYLFY